MFTIKNPLRLLTVLGAFTIAAGCHHTPQQTQLPPSKPVAVKNIDQLLSQANSESPASASATRLEAADKAIQQGNVQRAADIIKLVDLSLLDDLKRFQAGLIQTEIALDRQQTNQAQQALSQLDFSQSLSTSLNLQNRLAFAQANLAEAEQKYQEAFDIRFALETNLLPIESKANQEAIWRIVNKLPSNTAAVEGSELAAWIELSRIVKQSNSLQSQQQAIEQWRANNPNHPASYNLPPNVNELMNLEVTQPSKIGLVLPSTGPFQIPAEAIRNGFMAAYYASNSADDALEVRFYDSSRLNTLNALYQNAGQDGVELLVGPWEKDMVREMAAQPQLPIPTIALNYAETNGQTPINLYQFGIAPEDEARQAAVQAWANGLSHGLIIGIQDNAVSQRASQAFKTAFESTGGNISEVLMLAPNLPLEEQLNEALTNSLDAEFVFLQTSPPLAKRVRPLIQKEGIPLPVYAISVAVNDSQPDALNELEGVQFSEIPWFTKSDSVKSSITKQWPQATGNLGRFYAFGADAYQIATRLPQFAGISHTQIQGLTGILLLNDQRKVERYTDWVELRNGTLYELPNHATP